VRLINGLKNMNNKPYLVLRNQTLDGKRFRPSDWVDRLASNAGDFTRGRLQYDHHVMPCRKCDKHVCLHVDLSIAEDKPYVIKDLQEFMRVSRLPDYTSHCPRHQPALRLVVDNDMVFIQTEHHDTPPQKSAA
jgi:hypothetical protein